jgi:hypothetical protein
VPTPKHNVMKAYSGCGGTRIISELDGGEWLASRSVHFIPMEEKQEAIVKESECISEPVCTPTWC